MFLVVCCAEASWSLYLLTFTNPEVGTVDMVHSARQEDWAKYNSQMGRSVS